MKSARVNSPSLSLAKPTQAPFDFRPGTRCFAGWILITVPCLKQARRPGARRGSARSEQFCTVFALRLAQYDRVALVRHRFRRPCGVSRTLQLRRHRFSMAPSKISTSRAMGDVHGEEERNPRSRVVRLCRHFGNRCRAQELCPGARQGDGGRRASGAGSPETGEEKTSSAQAKGEGCEEEADQEDGVQKETSLIPPEALTSFPFALAITSSPRLERASPVAGHREQAACRCGRPRRDGVSGFAGPGKSSGTGKSIFSWRPLARCGSPPPSASRSIDLQ